MFIPLLKAVSASRLLYGSIDETPDRAGEVLDYASARPAFEAWSAGMQKASGGKSFGNIRAQHDPKKAAGLLTEISFDDEARRISFVAHIVDDQEWEKCEAGVYTGFSPGGSYAKRWQDGAYRRYTPKVGELSIVDVPCIPTAGFDLTKADGTTESVPFIIAQAYEPGNDATKARAFEMAKAARGEPENAGNGTLENLAKNFVVKARADLIAENADAELAKMADAGDAEPVVTTGPADAIAELMAKADAALAGTVIVIDAAGPFADLTKAAVALRHIVLPTDLMAKSMWQVSRLADLIDSFQCIACNVIYEANSEKDGSQQPAAAIDAMRKMGELLVMMAQEEVAEAIAGLPALEGAVITILDGDVTVMALAEQIVDLVKSDTDLMEKAGARNSRQDATSIQTMHDSSVALGAACNCDTEKSLGLAAENERLEKAVGESLPRLTGLIEKVGTLTAANTDLTERLAKALEQPAPAKGAVFAISKEQDAAGASPTAEPLAKSGLAAVEAMPNGMAKADAILRSVGTVPLPSL